MNIFQRVNIFREEYFSRVNIFRDEYFSRVNIFRIENFSVVNLATQPLQLTADLILAQFDLIKQRLPLSFTD